MSKLVALAWASGPGSQIELFSPDPQAAGSDYRLKYTPPFRHTIRPPLEELKLGAGELLPLHQELESVVKLVRGARGHPGFNQPAPGQLEQQMQLAASQLFDLIVPPAVAADLRPGKLFLEVGVDEELVQYPLELMHDGDNYLCLKHHVGRYVNSKSRGSTIAAASPAVPTRTMNKVKVLIISVHNPQPRPGGKTFAKLPGVEKEIQSIVDALVGVEWVELNILKNATYNDLYTALKTNTYQVIHYSGHAFFNNQKPYLSSLVLHDRDMTTGPLSNFIRRSPPILCFVNGCETGLTPGWGDNYDIFGLAQTFLLTGSYLLGSRWKLGDVEAADFAADFYTRLFKELKPIGQCLLEARSTCKAASATDSIAWASYIFYGDPRIGFCTVET